MPMASWPVTQGAVFLLTVVRPVMILYVTLEQIPNIYTVVYIDIALKELCKILP